TGGGDGVIKLWDVNSGAELRSIGAHQGLIFGVAFSPDGTHLASASADGTAKIWKPGTPDTPPLALTGHTDAVSRVAFSPDGKLLATSGVDGTARVWDAKTGAPVMTLGSSAPQPVANTASGDRVGLQPFRAMSDLPAQRN